MGIQRQTTHMQTSPIHAIDVRLPISASMYDDDLVPHHVPNMFAPPIQTQIIPCSTEMQSPATCTIDVRPPTTTQFSGDAVPYHDVNFFSTSTQMQSALPPIQTQRSPKCLRDARLPR